MPAAQTLQLLSVKQVAGMLGCSERHVWNMEQLGRIPPGVRMGRSVRWEAGVIDEWVKGGCPAQQVDNQ